MIEVKSLSRNYGALTAVDDVSFAIGDRQVVGLLGHNGAGKTTIMRMLSGYLEPSAGSIVFNDTDLSIDPRSIQRQLGYLPENPPVYTDMLLADYLDYAATLKGIAPAERIEAIHDAIHATDLESRILDPIRTLSRGMRQRAGVAQAILGRPQLLILDEPTNGLDPNQTEQMRELISQLARTAVVILSTHIMQEVDAICDRVLILNHGKLALDANLEDLRATRTLLLRACSGEQPLQDFLRRMPQVVRLHLVEDTQHWQSWRLELHENSDVDTAANNIAQCVVEAGGRLFLLHPEVRDLHTVFREVSSEGVMPDA